MWKYVSRRIRDTIEKSVNHFDRRSTTGVVNSAGNVSEEKNKRSAPPCRWFCARKCWSSFQDDTNDTNSKRWNFEQLNRTWIGAITWSGALVVGWYASQLVHLKLKYCNKRNSKSQNNLISSTLYPYISCVNQNPVYLSSVSQIEKVVEKFIPTVHLVTNDQGGGTDHTQSTGSTSSDTSDDDLGQVLNSIENKLGLAAIENGQHRDGLNLLRSAAHRNHAPAIYNLGLCYELGLGVTINEKSAMELYRAAAALEHPGALYNLGVYYGQGRGGLSKDPDMATRLLRLAAVQGQKDAIDALKALDIHVDDTTQPEQPEIPSPPEPSSTKDNFFYRCNPYDNNMIPAHSSLFVENVNYLRVAY